MSNPDLQSAFAAYDRQERIKNSKLGATLAIILMPAGVSLDYFVYPELLGHFFKLRLLCSLLVAGVLVLLMLPFGQKHYRVLGMTWYMLPAFFIAWMVYAANDPFSPYYAGLNIVLLGAGLILPWSHKENLLAVIAVIIMYLAACYLQETAHDFGYYFNNIYFLILTGLIVVVSSYAHSRLRFREFALRFELDKNQSVLAETNSRLVELDQIKNRFFANISHELRTPLTLLLAPLEMLLQRYKRSPDQDTHLMLATMHANGMRLLKLINDLLDLVRLESGRTELKREPVDLGGFIKGLASAARQVARDKRIHLEVAVAPNAGTVLADQDKLEKILLNLVFNALKFTPSGGRVEVNVSREGEEIVLQVRDTGVGISEQNLPFVFDRFWQADGSSKRKFQGAGIGLALVKELAEIQGGHVSVQSEEGKGATFTIRLPHEAAPEPAPVQAQSPEAGARGEGGESHTETMSEEWLTQLYRRAELFPVLAPIENTVGPVESRRDGTRPTVLVADDEPDMLRFLKSQLNSTCHVYEAADGQQAVEKAVQFLPDLILLDMMMPEKDGVQACRELRERASTQNIPIILLTARADEETKLAALSAGASDFLAKPFSTTELQVRIRNLIDSYHFQKKLTRQNELLEKTIEQLKETESQLVQSEKLASLGRMSAGIIHEINNPLNFATTGLYTLKNRTKYVDQEQRPEFEEILHDVEEGVTRVKTIVSNLRTFTHPDTESIDDVEVGKVLDSALHFLSNEWKGAVRIEKDIPERQVVRANQNCLLHVVVNLLQNSLDALRQKEFENGEAPTIQIRGCVTAGKSIVRIRDNGEGIDPEHLDKVFDPFFTTKEVGAGMGLGLSISYRLVRECAGQIRVQSERGKFCEFALEFPAKS